MQKRKWIITGILLIALVIIYFVIVNILVSAALVPSFMEKLDSFQRITEECFSQLVQTEDIETNRREALSDTKSWLVTVECQKLSLESEDGFTLIAEEFLPVEESQ